MFRRKLWLVLVAALTVAAVAAGIAVAEKDKGNDKNFEYAIGLWGDFPYSDVQAQVGVPNLIDDMNDADIKFSVQDGDLKAGSATANSQTPTTCADPLYVQALGFFNSLKKPAFFTPGDNDWTDCDRLSNGPFDSLERLTHERTVFFSGTYADRSLGQEQMKAEVQTAPLCQGAPSSPGDPRPLVGCIENRLWTFQKVTYVTLNVQGTCNNLCKSGSTADPSVGDANGDPAEYQARNAADMEWLQEAFDEADAKKSAGLMIIWQADPGFDTSGYQGTPKRDPLSLMQTDVPANQDGYHDILVELRNLTIGFKKPVVLVHGDSHYFRVDKPLVNAQGRRLENFTRVETFGDNQANGINDVHWVKALVDPSSRDVFAFQPQIVPANRVAVPAP